MQYMIITDLTKDLDQFVNPDDLNGVIEVFEIRNSFANINISDIQTQGIRGSLSNENYFSIGQGAAPIDNKFEIKQIKNSFFEDSQDILYGGTSFSPKLGYETMSGSLGFEGAVADEQRIMSPFSETSSDDKFKFKERVRNFLSISGYDGPIASETIVPEMGTRYRASNRGFIQQPNYGIIGEDYYIDAGTDSIAFVGLNKN